MAAHQYWRLTGFLTDSNALELSQAQLYAEDVLIDQAPTFTVPPTTGAAFPDMLRWDDFSMPGFALLWNLSTPVEAPNLRLGAGTSAATFPKELYCQYSDDGKFWSTNSAPVNIEFPGAWLLTTEPGTGTVAGDPDFSKVSLLLRMDGDNLSTSFSDSSSSPKTVTAVGGAALSTAISRFGGSSGAFNGSGAYLSIPHSPELSLITGDFTIECWIHPLSLSATPMAVWSKDGVAGVSYPQYGLDLNADGRVQLFLGNGNGTSPAGTDFIGPDICSLNAWQHVAIVRVGGTCMGFLEGIPQWSAPAPNMYEGSKPLRVGYQTGQPSSAFFKGYIDDLRITKGLAQYTSAFTPPVAAFSGGTDVVIPFIPLSGAPAPKRWRSLARPAEPMVGSPVQDFNLNEFTPRTSFMDVYHGGRGIIRATVKQKNTPDNTPLRRRVDLLDERSRLVIRSTWSDAVTGIYAFAGIREDLAYTVVSYDMLHDKRAVIADNLTLANGGVELMP